MNRERPIFLDLTKIRFPVPAIASILHRLSGLFVFLVIPFFLWIFHQSLNPDGFMRLQHDLQNPFILFFIWVVFAALLFHLIAGIRHLLMDISIGESLRGGRLGAWIVMITSGVFIVLAGIWLW